MASQLKNDLIAWCKSVVPNDIVMPVGDNKAPRYKHANNSGRGTFCTYTCNAMGRTKRHSFAGSVRGRHRLYGNRQRWTYAFLNSRRLCARGRRKVTTISSSAPNLPTTEDITTGQRIHKVDFKTICSNGTGGFIVVAFQEQDVGPSKISTTYLPYRTNC
jgi:hypothetical protein